MKDAVAFSLHHPCLLRRESFFQKENACKTKETGIRTGVVTIANHSAIVENSRRVAHLLRILFLDGLRPFFGESQKGTPGRGRDRKCHDRASLSCPFVLSFLTSLTSFPFSVLQRTLMGGAAGGASDKMGWRGRGRFVMTFSDVFLSRPLFCFPSPFFGKFLHGVGADGVGVKFPIFAVNCCCLPLSFRRRGKMRKKRGKSLRPHLHQPH